MAEVGTWARCVTNHDNLPQRPGEGAGTVLLESTPRERTTTMRTALLPLLLTLGCAEGVDLSVPDDGVGGNEADDSGPAGDDGGPGGDDTGWGGEDAACGVDDLRWVAEVRLDDGTLVHMTETGVAVTVVGVVENPCAEPIRVELQESCLVKAFDVIERATGDGEYEGISCLQTARVTDLAPGGRDETALYWGSLPPGEFDVTAHFAVEGRRATTELVVR